MNDKIPAALASIKLLPCPFCGREAVAKKNIMGDERVGCNSCAPTAAFTSEEWNRRATLPPPALDEAYEAQWQMKHWACRAHELCNELRIKHPEIVELSDEGILHCAIHSILGIYTPHAAPIGNQTASPGAP